MTIRERFTVTGKKLARNIEQLVSRGDVRRVCLIQEEKTVLEIPVNLGGDPVAPGTMIAAPILAAINAFGTLVNECTVEVERTGKAKQKTVKNRPKSPEKS